MDEVEVVRDDDGFVKRLARLEHVVLVPTDISEVEAPHYRRILEHLTPDAVHILLGGRIVASGGRELADRLEGEGFDAFRTAEVGG